MAVFKDLPVELLLQVAYHLKGDIQSLRHLALTSHWLLLPAQEALHREIVVENKYTSVNSSRKIVAQSYHLIRTLFTRPDLARKVRAVRLDVLEWPDVHSRDCGKLQNEGNGADLDPSCSCDYAKIQRLCARVVQGMEMRLWLAKKTPCLSIPRQQRHRHYRRWLQDINNEYEPALVAVLLHLLPSLESLSLATYHASGKALSTLLGVGDRQWRFSPRLVAGFSGLRSLTTTFLPPWSIITLPTLRTLHIETGDIHIIYETKYDEAEVVPYKLLDHTDGCANVTTLIFDLEVTILTRNLGHYEDDLYGSLRNLLMHLGAVTHFEIRLFYDDTVPHHVDLDEGEVLSYGDLMPLLQVPSLETLIIDTSGVDWDKYADNETGRPYETWQAEGVEPLDLPNFDWHYTIPELTNLRRIVLPQEALFFHYRSDSRFDFRIGQENFLPCALPLSVEVVEVIDSTRMLNHWANYVLNHRHQFPSLRQVVLWCDRLSAPLSYDQRFRQETADGVDRDEAEARREYKLKDDVGDGVWGDLQKIGVDLVVNMKQDRGWRIVG